MIRIVFVNNDRAVLEHLQHGLQHSARRWQMLFVASAEEALTELARRPTQLIVTDMRMPGMDGATLLGLVRARYPETVRFVLGNKIGRDEADHLMQVAHQVLIRPDDVVTLQRAIERIAALLGHGDNPVVKRAIKSVQNLPPLPDLYFTLAAELDKPGATSSSVAAIIERDPGMTTRVLQMANSPYFSFGQPVGTVRDAATRLGMQQLRSAVLMLALSANRSAARLPKGFSMQALQNRSLRVASLAVSMFSNAEGRKIAFSAGMLHHVGYFILAGDMPQDYAKVMATAASTGQPIEHLELEMLGCDHTQVGAFMLTLLGLPLPLVEAVAHHHRPSGSGEMRFSPPAALHIACLLAAEAENQPEPEDAWDSDYLRRLGVADVVAHWRAGEPIKAVF